MRQCDNATYVRKHESNIIARDAISSVRPANTELIYINYYYFSYFAYTYSYTPPIPLYLYTQKVTTFVDIIAVAPSKALLAVNLSVASRRGNFD